MEIWGWSTRGTIHEEMSSLRTCPKATGENACRKLFQVLLFEAEPRTARGQCLSTKGAPNCWVSGDLSAAEATRAARKVRPCRSRVSCRSQMLGEPLCYRSRHQECSWTRKGNLFLIQCPSSALSWQSFMHSCWQASISSSVQLSRSVVSDSLPPHALQHARLPCPSPNPRAYSNSYPSSQWCHPTISCSVVPFYSHLQSFPTSRSFQMSQFFTTGGQSIGVSDSA